MYQETNATQCHQHCAVRCTKPSRGRYIHSQRPEKMALKEAHRQTLSNKGRAKGLSFMEQRGKKFGQMININNSTDERNACMDHEKGLIIFLKEHLYWGVCLLLLVILSSEASL